MKKATTYLLLSCLLCCTITHAQQGNNWYFGTQAGLNFNTTPPTPILNSVINTNEGCASISDSLGQTLFYTDGRFVYNKLNQAMPNGTGLMGHPSSTHSSIVIRKPGSDSLYYIFTVDAAENNYLNGYRYSIVDMSLNGGLGDVSTKNILMYGPCSEKIAAVGHANGIDVWIVTKDFTGDIYRVYRLGCDGLDMTPVFSNVGEPFGVTGIIRVGAIKASPDGRFIATARFSGYWEIFHFNNVTGKLSDPLKINTPVSNIFGVEFAPNSELVYIGSECCAGNGVIYQYKLDAYDAALIRTSAYRVDSSRYLKSDMQMGPDGKIYGPNFNDSTLNIIHNPNVYGPGCNYQYKGINLTWGKMARRCLPSFYKNNISNSHVVDFTYAVSPANCNEISFTATTSLAPPVTYSWDFGGGITATGQTVTMTFNNTNNLTVKLVVANAGTCGARAVRTKTLDYNSHKPLAKFGHIAECGNAVVLFKDSSSIAAGNIASWEWDFGDNTSSILQNPQHTYGSFGSYDVRLIVTANGLCPKRDTMEYTIDVNAKPVVSFTTDQNCIDRPVQFIPTSNVPSPDIDQWIWYFGDTQGSGLQNPTHTYASATIYNSWLVVKHNNGCASDTFRLPVRMSAKPVARFSFDPACTGDAVSFIDNSSISAGDIVSWYWNFGNANTGITKNGSSLYPNGGSYLIKHTAVSEGGCVSDTAYETLSVQDKPEAIFSFSKECNSDRVVFTNHSTIGFGTIHSYEWNFGDGNNSTTKDPVHIYAGENDFPVTLTVSNASGCKSIPHTETISISKMHLFAGNDTVAFTGQPIQLNAVGTGNISWAPSFGLDNPLIANPVATLQGDQTYIVKAIAPDGCTKSDTINIKVYSKPDIFVPTAFTPNGDGRNDLLGPLCFGIKKLHYFTLYNRWGQIIFSTKEINGRWNGTYKGAAQNTETFVWMVRGESFDGRVISKQGVVTLIR